jgi:LemA protein
MILIYIIIGIIVLLVLWAIGAFNLLVSLKTRCQEAWSDIEVQLKRRYDLIPNLVESVKGYAKHEKRVFESVTEARVSAMKSKTPAQHAATENMLTEALKSIFAVAENYPDLKASDNFKSLQDELTDTENKIEAARRFYNSNVRDLNISIDSFPSNIIANLFKFEKLELFDLKGEEEKKASEPVKVNFDDKEPK